MDSIDDKPSATPAEEAALRAIQLGGKLEGVTVTEVRVHRWSVEIDFVVGEGVLTMVASADSSLTDMDGIWWGTPAAADEKQNA